MKKRIMRRHLARPLKREIAAAEWKISLRYANGRQIALIVNWSTIWRMILGMKRMPCVM